MSIDQLPVGVRAAVLRGEVPPPRKPNEPYDEIRDLKLAVAIATDAGDWNAVSRLNSQMLEAMRRGETTSWQPQPRRQQDTRPKTRDELMREARLIERNEALTEDFRAARAEQLKARALHAPEADATEHLEAAAKLDSEGKHAEADVADHLAAAAKLDSEGKHAEADAARVRALAAKRDSEGKHAEADAARVRALAALRGDVDVAPVQPPAKPMPSDLNEFNAAINEAESAGDHTTANRLRAGMLAYRRAQQERAVDYAPVTPDHAGGS